MALIDDCRMALRVTTTAFDPEIQLYMDAALGDLKVNGVIVQGVSDPLIRKAVMTYVKMSWGSTPDKDREKLKDDYKDQKATLKNATGYTDWGGDV